MTSLTTTYWCYRCARFVSGWSQNEAVSCPYCYGGFVEELPADTESSPGHQSSPMVMLEHAVETRDRTDRAPNFRLRRRRPNAGDRSPFNPVIVLRGPTSDSDSESNTFELYYDDGTGSGLRPLPAAVSDFLMGSGFDRLLEQLAQLEITGLGRPENPPASKAAIESMPTIEIGSDQVHTELHCAVCKEAFELGSEAREMPCKHVYHSDCILPWLSMRNSCPVCRHELPAETTTAGSDNSGRGGEEEPVGLTIWRLPGGAFAVGRFRRGGERELPGVFTEMDGGFNGSSGAPRNVPLGLRSRGSERGGLGRIFRNMVSFFSGRSRSNRPSDSDSGSIRRSRSLTASVVGGYRRRRNRTWVLED